MHLQYDAIGRFPTGLKDSDGLFGGPGESANYLSRNVKHMRISAGKFVFAIGDEVLQIYIHRNGQVLVFTQSGHSRHTCLAEPDMVYGLIEAIAGNKCEFGMRAVTDSEFDVIKISDLIYFLQTSPIAAFKLAQNLGRMYQQAMHLIKSH